MRIDERDLMKMATAYIDNGILKKWRHSSADRTHIDAILDEKCVKGKAITEEELKYIIKTYLNIVIVNDNSVQFINFSGRAWKF